MKAAYIIDVVRTPVGKYGGALSGVRPDDLLAHVIKALITRNPQLDINQIEDVIAGDANQAGEDTRNVARMASLLAGLPVTVAGNTVNRLCASGLQAIMDCGRSIFCGEGSAYIAGGVESMSRAPFVMARSSYRPKENPANMDSAPETGSGEIYDTTIGWRFTNKKLAELYYPYSMGETAENVASQWHISRAEQDEYAFHSHAKFFDALEKDIWKDEIVPVEIPHTKESKGSINRSGVKNAAEQDNEDGRGNKFLFSTDEHPRRTSLETLGLLKPAFSKNGTVTAGNSSGLNDGAAAMLIVSEEALKKYGLTPMARIVSMAVAGVDPSIMGMGSVPASLKALRRANLSVQDMDLMELNESFASQSIACIRELDADAAKVNVNGGSIAIGHPLGCSGARISATLLHEMKRRGARYGLAGMCAGLGQGAAIVYENMQTD